MEIAKDALTRQGPDDFSDLPGPVHVRILARKMPLQPRAILNVTARRRERSFPG